MNSPFYNQQRISPLFLHQYNRYLPTAFDESMSLLQKVNKVIRELEKMGEVSNEVIDHWNDVSEWIINEGMENVTIDTLEKWYEDGKFADLVIQILEELKEFGVNVKNYGAVGDGVSDDIEAFEKAIATGYPVYVPNGKFALSRGLAIPSNFVMSGSGIDNAVIMYHATAKQGDSLIYNKDIQTGNQNIYLSDFTLDGNLSRFGTTEITGSGGSRDSNLTIRASSSVHIHNVKSVNAILHGFDVTCGGLDYPYLGDGTTAPNPSSFVTISNCESSNFGDDGFTTHHSEYINISNCYSHTPRFRGNQNGIEVDDGSRHITLNNNTTKGNYGGVEIKAHENAPAPYNVVINGHTSVEDVRSYNFRHIGYHSDTDPDSVSAKNIICNSLVSVNPNNTRGFQNEASPRVVAISAYYGVVINGLTAYTVNSSHVTDACITVQFKARNVTLNGIALTGFSQATDGIYVIGGSRNGDHVNISNVTLLNTGKNGIAVGSGITTVNITNVSAINESGTGTTVVKTVNSNPQISNVSGTGYENECVVAGQAYNDGLTLFNGAFRAASTSSGEIDKEGFVIGSTASSQASASKSGVVASSSSNATGERSFIASSADSTASGTYNSILGSLSVTTTNVGNLISTSGTSTASGNRGMILSSYGVLQDGSYKVNGGYGEPDINGNPLTSNIKWELDGLTGNIRAAGAITGSSTWADYAEYFETLDGNKIDSGYLVALQDGKIRKATATDQILGVISETAGVALGESTWTWANKYLTNEFGGYIYEVQEIKSGELDESGNEILSYEKMPKINPNYKMESDYESRAIRDEWCIVGLIGQVYVRIDETVKINEGISAVEGVATTGDYGTVMKITTPYDVTKGYGVAKVMIR